MDAINGPEVDLDELAARTRAQLARRQVVRRSASELHAMRSAHELPENRADTSPPPIDDCLVQEVPRPDTVHLNLPEPLGIVDEPGFEPTTDGQYSLKDLLKYHDREFIQAAYRAVVGRPPDVDGFGNYLGHLRRGMAKIEILEALRYSPEGQKVAAQVVGLSRRCAFLKISRWPLIGPLFRIASALFGLPEYQRSQRALHGEIIAKIEACQLNARNGHLVLRRALYELQDGHQALLNYAASKPGQDLVRKIEIVAAQSTVGLTALRNSLEAKVNREDLQRSTGELQGLLQILQSTKAEKDDLQRTARGVREVSTALHNLSVSKADLSALNEARERLIRILEDKPERRELIDLIGRLRDSIRIDVGEVSAALATLNISKAESSRVEETRQELIHALETKPERYELTALTNYLVSLVESRLIMEDITPLQESHAALARQATEDRVAFESARDNTTVEMQGIQGTLESIVQSKADRRMLEEVRAEIKSVDWTLEKLRQTTTAVLASKVDASLLQSLRADVAAIVEASRAESGATHKIELQEINRKFESIAHSHVAYGDVLNKLNGELQSSLRPAIHEVREEIRSLLNSKADRAGVDAAHVELANTIVTARADAANSLQAATKGLGQYVDSVLQTKAGCDALELVRTELKGTLETTLSAVAEKAAVLSQSKAGVELLKTSMTEMKNSIDAVHRRLQEELAQALVPIAAQTQDTKRTLLDQERRLGLLLEEARKRLPKQMTAKQMETIVAEDTHLLDAMYASFEDRFRGTRADIKQRATIYLPYMRAANAGSIKSPVIDLGCGRGEWLELLRDEGFVGHGVDTNRVFLDICREMNLDVIGSDALEYLRGLKPNSFGAITSFHLIEHLPMKLLIALIDESLRVLKPGGIVILETPNPENLQVGACNFYTDPTHRNPIPPVLTEALLELRGFVRPVIVRRDQEKMRGFAPPHIANGQPLAVNINPIIEVMLTNFFVSPDYAVVATKA